MKIVFLGDKYKQLNRIHKNCLKKTESVDYIDEEDSEKNFAIYENESLLGMIETCLAEDKAGLQMVRFKIENKSWIEQRQILKAFIDYIWNFESINHIVLAIHVNIDGSGLEEDILRHLGFVGSLSFGGGTSGSPLYTLLNPDYIHIARTNSTDVETIEQLTKYYIFYQKRCQVQLKELKQNLESCKVLFYDTSDLKYQQRIKYYHESIEALDAIEQIRRRLWNASQIIKL